MKYVTYALSLILIILMVVGGTVYKKSPSFLSFQERLEYAYQYITNYIGITKHNLSFDYDPVRRRPLSFLERETKIQSAFLADREPYVDFSQEEWNDFWRNLWGLIFDPIAEKEGKFTVKRYRTIDEIEGYLIFTYPDPFERLSRQHWDYFWSIVFGKS